MGLRTWRFITLLLAALLMGTTFGHTLEMPMKMQVDGPLWMTFQHTLYLYFAYVGGPVEAGAILVAIVLAVLVRKRRRVFYLVLGGAVCLAVAFLAVWVGFVSPVNAQTATWTAETIPPDWAQWRAQWEYAHATRFVLHLVGFSALVLSVLIDTPAHAPRDRAS